tara:strand:+ start:230 stop:397 length:168 start_codon:yes stop_codon:yes gene_type:complete
MASSSKYILQNPSTGEYLTSSGWSSDIADAKSFSKTDLNTISPGNYIQHTVWAVS